MSFGVHIHQMHKKVMGILLLVNRIRDKFDAATRKIVIQSLALSGVNYCLQVYGTTNNTRLRRVHMLQNFAAKIYAGGARRSNHATPSMTQLQWLKVDKKIIPDVSVTVFKVKNKVFQDGFMYLPTSNEFSHSRYTTRQLHNLYVPHTTTDCGGRALSVLGPKIWNALPRPVTDTTTLQTFRDRQKTFLLNET